VGLYWVLVLSRWECVILGVAEWLRMFRKESVWKLVSLSLRKS
jgi:hypothetical protein